MSITVTSKVLDVLVVLDVVVVGVGVGAAAPLIGTSPARTVIEISPVRTIASTKRFMFGSPLIDDASLLVSEMAKSRT